MSFIGGVQLSISPQYPSCKASTCLQVSKTIDTNNLLSCLLETVELPLRFKVGHDRVFSALLLVCAVEGSDFFAIVRFVFVRLPPALQVSLRAAVWRELQRLTNVTFHVEAMARFCKDWLLVRSSASSKDIDRHERVLFIINMDGHNGVARIRWDSQTCRPVFNPVSSFNHALFDCYRYW